MAFRDDLAAMGMEMVEDDHLVTLRCGKKERVYSALGVSAETLVKEANEMATQRRMRSWRRGELRNRGRRRHG